MPKLLTSTARPKKLPPCGRRIEYHEPHSPFQKLIDSRRLTLGLSFRDLGSELGVHSGTVWIWMHSKNGFPHPKSFKETHLASLARVLQLTPEEIRTSLDASRHLYTARENPVPQGAQDSLALLIQILEASNKRVIHREWLLNLAKRLQAGATSPDLAPAPAARRPRAPRPPKSTRP